MDTSTTESGNANGTSNDHGGTGGSNDHGETSGSSEEERQKFCHFCGRKLPEGAVFCPACGERLDASGGDSDGGSDASGLSIASMVVGIVGLVFCWVPFVGFVISAVAVGLAIPAANQQQRYYEWALGLSLVGAFAGLIFSVDGRMF